MEIVKQEFGIEIEVCIGNRHWMRIGTETWKGIGIWMRIGMKIEIWIKMRTEIGTLMGID